MLMISEFAAADAVAAAAITLPFEQRQKARLKAHLDSGEAVGLTLPRGKVLRGGDKLAADSGLVVEIIAAQEPVSTIRTADALLFAKVCYHLGNRHVPLEISQDMGGNFCRYAQDHVLDDLVKNLLSRRPDSGTLVREQMPFEPEAGAYANSDNLPGLHHHHSH